MADSLTRLLGVTAEAVAAVLALILLPVLAVAQTAVPLSGTVSDTTGARLANVAITIRGAATRIVHTDSEGRFAFPDLHEGQYELTAVASGFAPAQKIVKLVSGDRTTLALTLSVLLQEQALVTATRTGERDVQAAPMAISVLPGNELQRAEAHTVADIAGLAPSLTFSQNTGFAQLTIRGIGTNVVFAGSDPSSAVYIDGVYFARPAAVLGHFLELERVEVLRGP
jgi:outer membrane receptor protein involved in Fe transport